jgi:hypothetical protein
LTKDLVCPANHGYSLSEHRNVNKRYFNVYRAADGAFCMGKKAFKSNDERYSTRDSERAIFGLSVEFDETADCVTAERV